MFARKDAKDLLSTHKAAKSCKIVKIVKFGNRTCNCLSSIWRIGNKRISVKIVACILTTDLNDGIKENKNETNKERKLIFVHWTD